MDDRASDAREARASVSERAVGLSAGMPLRERLLTDQRERALEAQWPRAGLGDRVLHWVWIALLLGLLALGAVTSPPPGADAASQGYAD